MALPENGEKVNNVHFFKMSTLAVYEIKFRGFFKQLFAVRTIFADPFLTLIANFYGALRCVQI
jgi:hypothetical protein